MIGDQLATVTLALFGLLLWAVGKVLQRRRARRLDAVVVPVPRRSSELFDWADIRARAQELSADTALLEDDIDEFSLELTRYGMRQDGVL